VTQVNFYTLSSEDSQSRYQFACRLAEKAVALGHRVLIQTDSSATARQLDDLLWQFKPASFLPHARISDESGPVTESVSIAADPSVVNEGDVLINLGESACQVPDQFNRINEILTSDPEVLKAGRASYRYYQSKGLQPETHKL
jgi:DNA polymerase-3 subunit chi